MSHNFTREPHLPTEYKCPHCQQFVLAPTFSTKTIAFFDCHSCLKPFNIYATLVKIGNGEFGYANLTANEWDGVNVYTEARFLFADQDPEGVFDIMGRKVGRLIK